VASDIITLPGHLRVLFDNIYAGEPVSGNAWVVWQRVLQARVQEPAFIKRVAAVQRACRSQRHLSSPMAHGDWRRFTRALPPAVTLSLVCNADLAACADSRYGLARRRARSRREP
jgi:hypothetical protein